MFYFKGGTFNNDVGASIYGPLWMWAECAQPFFLDHNHICYGVIWGESLRKTMNRLKNVVSMPTQVVLYDPGLIEFAKKDAASVGRPHTWKQTLCELEPR